MAAWLMVIEVEQIEGVGIVKLAGRRFGAADIAEFRTTFGKLLSACNTFVIDLNDVEFIDSLGLGGLIYALKAARESGGDVKLCRMSDSVYRTFKLVQLQRVFQIFESSTGALAAIANSEDA
jgi:anti-sigma B factor antagonist